MKLKRKQQTKGERNQPPRPDESLPTMLMGGEAEVHSRWAVLLLAGLTWVLSLPLFAPWGFWPGGYVVFVPWLLAVALSSRPVWVYLVSYLLGAGFYLMHFRWLCGTTWEGYLLASLLYVAPLFVPAAWLTRHLHRTRGWCLAFAFPLAWTAQELAHSRGPLAFPWFLLGHSQYRCLSMIQIADLAGVYGVSLVVAAANGLAADLLLRSFIKRRGKKKEEHRRQVVMAAVVVVGLLGSTLAYGQFRLHQGGQVEGPKVAVVQGDFPLSTGDDPNAPSESKKRALYMRLAGEALADGPDLVVLPETPWDVYLNAEALKPEAIILPNKRILEVMHKLTAEQLRLEGKLLVGDYTRSKREFSKLAVEHHAWLAVGGVSMDVEPGEDERGYPRFNRYNSAFVFGPDGAEPARYDKINLVLFGEYVPFRYSCYRLYRFLNDGVWNPWGAGGLRDYSITAGKNYTTFPVQPRPPGKETRFGVTICYEDVIPQVFRRFILDERGVKAAGFMLNMSNDGWFGYGTQQAQHLVNCAFRAVENRVSVARSANTGISGFVRPDGSWHDLVQREGARLHAGGSGHRTARVMLDSRITFYSRFGDVLPVGWSMLAVAGIADAGWCGWKKWRGRPKRSKRKAAK